MTVYGLDGHYVYSQNQNIVKASLNVVIYRLIP